MDSGSTSYCVYTPGNLSPTRPPLRREAPEQARSGFPFLIGLAALVLFVAIGSVAGFCPQDLRLDGGKHPAKATTTVPAAAVAPPMAAATTPVIPPTTFTTIGAPADPPPATSAASKKKPAFSSAPSSRTGLPTTRGATSASPASSASATASNATPALPDNPYP